MPLDAAVLHTSIVYDTVHGLIDVMEVRTYVKRNLISPFPLVVPDGYVRGRFLLKWFLLLIFGVTGSVPDVLRSTPCELKATMASVRTYPSIVLTE